jgi:RimJ/RimL family protein N-acetyltransferase
MSAIWSGRESQHEQGAAMPAARPILIDLPNQFVGVRVLARQYIDEDAAALHATIEISRVHLQRWLPGFDHERSLDDIRESIRRSQAQSALRESFSMGLFLFDGTLIGDLRLRPTNWQIPAFDIAYWLRPDAIGQGYAGEAVQLLTSFAFERLHAGRVAISCDPANTRSAGVAQRLGYRLEGRLRNSAIGPDGLPCDLLLFALTPEDYAHARAGWPSVS